MQIARGISCSRCQAIQHFLDHESSSDTLWVPWNAFVIQPLVVCQCLQETKENKASLDEIGY